MREKDSQKTEAIYNATLKLVLREGFTALKMGDVAKEAKVATGTLYIYFENKEELINQLYLELKRRNANELLKGHDDKAPFMMSFEKLWRNYLAVQLQKPEVAAFLEQYYRSPYFGKQVAEETAQVLEPIFDLLERGKAERLVKNIPTELLVIQLTGAIAELVRWHHVGQIKITNDTIDKILELAWDSVKR